ncbi:N-acetylmannosaminyltransferase [hydrothermal vent metagenome]|uniref:N-acetylmannosaminyltransferase n=1 Tax=hydrothermal vent metagenome TaxID=652676 RepID=A0A3B1DH80_9ZZZZ
MCLPKNVQKIDILGVKVDAINLSLACQRIECWIQKHIKTYVCIAPVATIIDAQKDVKYREIVNNAGMVTPDGMPVVWIGKKLKKNKVIERTYGPDLMRDFCQLSQDKGYRHYFYGGLEDTLVKLKSNLLEQFPRLNISGLFSPPMLDIGEDESQDVLDQINAAKPDVLWVGLGSPKQDYWMVQHRNKLDVPVMIGVGAAFDFFAGTKRQAPVWIQKSGLEWLFRLCSEPKRLWRRYVLGNTLFIFLILKETITGRIFKPS